MSVLRSCAHECYIRSAPVLVFPRLQRFSITLRRRKKAEHCLALCFFLCFFHIIINRQSSHADQHGDQAAFPIGDQGAD
ncbi:hypothetical protein EI692_05960 [Bacillus safensis]|nr:hypothetical protein EI692_05960 [Bacillus safensis]